MIKIIDVKSKPLDIYNRCDHFVKYLYNGIYFEGTFTQHYIYNKGLKDIIKEYHSNRLLIQAV